MKTVLILAVTLIFADGGCGFTDSGFLKKQSFISSAHAGSCEEGWVLREDGMCEILSKPGWTDKTCNEWLDGDNWVWDDVGETCVKKGEDKDKAPKKEKK